MDEKEKLNPKYTPRGHSQANRKGLESGMLSRLKKPLIIITIIAAAILLRVIALSERPMHADEAGLAYVFKELLEEGRYVYTPPRDVHGPVLHYFSLPVIWLSGDRKLEEVSECQLRTVTVIAGVLCVVALLILPVSAGTIAAMAAVAIAPSTVFFSRYFIHEILLLLFTLLAIGSGWRFLQGRKKVAWACLAGISAGLMHATKETCTITFFGAAVAIVILWLLRPGGHGRRMWPSAVPGIIAAVAVSVLFFSSFGSNWDGVEKSLTAYGAYLERGTGQTEASLSHVRPWYYYLQTLVYRNRFPWISGESVILLWAVAGFGLSFRKNGKNTPSPALVRFCFLFSIITLGIYSSLGYKTPWCVIQPLAGLFIAAGAGVAYTAAYWRPVAVLAIVLTASALLAQSVHDNYKTRQDYLAPNKMDNPYVLVHTSSDVFCLLDTIDEELSVIPGIKKEIRVYIITSFSQSPLRWYMQDYGNLGFFRFTKHNREEMERKISEYVSSSGPPDMYICPPAMNMQVLNAIWKGAGKNVMYRPIGERAVWLRPGVEIQGVWTNTLHDKILYAKTRESIQGK